MMSLSMVSIILPALMAGLLVLSTHVVLGRQVLKRGIIFIDLALAQIAALGAVVAGTNHHLAEMPGSQVWMPALFALIGSGVIAGLERRFRSELEALIGCLYVLSAVVAMMVLSNDPHGGEQLKQILSGQILWTDWPDLQLPLLITLVMLALWLWRPGLLSGKAFYPMFAVLITFSVQLVGVYLVFSSLILPALAANRHSGSKALVLAFGCGIVGYGVGLMASALWDLPSGATIVCALAGATVLTRLIAGSASKVQAAE